ncbi:hypothetical protein ABPG75_001832 [Micractinium tetrahymenae]
MAEPTPSYQPGSPATQLAGQQPQPQHQQPPPQQQEATGGQRLVGRWALSTHIGAGSFAIVWRARHVDTGAEAAIKEINLSKLNSKLRQSLESEVSILKRVRHGNIVTLLEVIEEEGRLFLVMEYCAGGDLAHFLRRVKRVPEAVARHLMRQLAAGLREMWAHHLVHRDLKPQNLLLSASAPDATLKIADFGFARNLQPQGLAETLCGSPLYMAPEILHFHKYDAKADLWSIGTILYELVVGRPPFTGANQFQLLRCIERNEARVPEGIAAQLSPPCRHLIHCLLRRNPVERLSFEEFFRHPFVATPEEAAAPLPPRAPLPAAGGIAASLAAAAAGGAGPRGQLLFSTSAPAAAAAALGAASGRARNGGGGAAVAPQQVLGFQQQRDSSGRLGAAQLAGQGSPGSLGAAVPVGGLSHQLKPRRSLDLDSAAQQQQAQHAQQAQQQRQQQHPTGQLPAQWQAGPRRPQPVASRRLGSIQRVQGFQPAPLPGQPAWAPGAVAPSSAATGQQAPSAPPPLGSAGVRPASQRHQQLLGAGSAVAGAAQAAGAASSQHSEDDDYVLVDPSLSAHTAVGRSSKQVSPPVSRSPSGEGASLANSRHSTSGTEEGIFASQPADSPAAAASAAPPPAWLGGPRWRRLQRVARVLQDAAAARQAAPGGTPSEHGQLRKCLSLHLAALQVLDHALEAHSAEHSAAVAAAAAAEPGTQAGQPGEAGDIAALAAAAAELQHEAGDSMAAAEAAAAALDKAGREPSPTSVTPAAAAVAEAEAALPDPWELLYAAALGWGREAAVDELLGNQLRSAALYERAGAALSFLSGEAAGLALEPPAELAPADRTRLQKYASATAARWAACAAHAGSAGGCGGCGAEAPR